jgi:hypothetical protein
MIVIQETFVFFTTSWNGKVFSTVIRKNAFTPGIRAEREIMEDHSTKSAS